MRAISLKERRVFLRNKYCKRCIEAVKKKGFSFEKYLDGVPAWPVSLQIAGYCNLLLTERRVGDE